MAKKRVLNFECPNCNAKNQDRFLAVHNGDKPKIWCTKCDSTFTSRVIERIYYMVVTAGRAMKTKLTADPSEGLISPIPSCIRCGRLAKYCCEICKQELCEYHADIHSSPPYLGGCVKCSVCGQADNNEDAKLVRCDCGMYYHNLTVCRVHECRLGSSTVLAAGESDNDS